MHDRLRSISVAAAAGLLAASLSAQLQPGTTAPPFDFDQRWNDAPTSFAELEGKLVLLDYFATW